MNFLKRTREHQFPWPYCESQSKRTDHRSLWKPTYRHQYFHFVPCHPSHIFIFRGYRKRLVAWNGLRMFIKSITDLHRAINVWFTSCRVTYVVYSIMAKLMTDLSKSRITTRITIRNVWEAKNMNKQAFLLISKQLATVLLMTLKW